MIRRDDLARQLGVGVRTLVRWAQQGYGPQAVKVGHRAVRYRRAEVDEWLARRAATGEVSEAEGEVWPPTVAGGPTSGVDRPRVVTEPGVRFGAPHVRGISVSAITEQVEAANSDVNAVAEDYDLRREDVLVACWWVAGYGSAAQQRLWEAWAHKSMGAMADGRWGDVGDPPCGDEEAG